jgi:hypothetical protein
MVWRGGAARLAMFWDQWGHWASVAAVGLGAAAVAAGAVWTAFEAAATSADNLSDAAARLNVSPEALQAYRFALEEIGGSAQDADAGLEGLNQRIGTQLSWACAGQRRRSKCSPQWAFPPMS